jgi:hypothetical protein
MPLSPGPSVPMDMPPDLAAAATASDDMIGGELGALIPPPEKPYNPRVMTSLANAIAEVMSAMGVEMTPEPYTGPVEQFGEDEARFLTMIEAAAADYGQPLPVGVAELKGDAELTTLTAALSQLAQDAEFIAFLDEGAEPEPMARRRSPSMRWKTRWTRKSRWRRSRPPRASPLRASPGVTTTSSPSACAEEVTHGLRFST